MRTLTICVTQNPKTPKTPKPHAEKSSIFVNKVKLMVETYLQLNQCDE